MYTCCLPLSSLARSSRRLLMRMRRVGQRGFGLVFTCMIALTIMGAGLDALPVSWLWDAVGSEDVLDDTSDDPSDDSSDDFGVDDDVSWLEIQPGVRRREPGPPTPVVEIATPVPTAIKRGVP